MTGWKYKVETLPYDPKAFEARLDGLGAGGWELVSVVPSPAGTVRATTGDVAGWVCVFKKPK